MKTLLTSAFAFAILATSTAMAHDVHHTNSDHTHPGPVYTHSVSSHYDHHNAHHNNRVKDHVKPHTHYHSVPKVTTNTATYYTRSYPVQSNYTYYTTPNTTIHQPPYAYSSCAGNCQTSKRIMVSRNIGQRSQTYRAPSEYKAGSHYVNTPRKVTNCSQSRTTHVSPYRTHKLTTCNTYGCNY